MSHILNTRMGIAIILLQAIVELMGVRRLNSFYLKNLLNRLLGGIRWAFYIRKAVAEGFRNI